jgi:ribosomal protein S18 acetylase RimI-like enzyme
MPYSGTIAAVADEPTAIIAVERAAAAAWPAPIRDSIGDWWMRSAEGFTGRANSALPIGDPGMPIEAALDRVEAFYRQLDRPPTIDIPLPLGADVEAAVLARRWEWNCTVLVQVADLASVCAATAGRPTVPLLDRPSADHLEQIRGARGALPPAGIHVLTAVSTLVFAEYREDELLARARGSITDGWLGVYGVATQPAARRRGLAAAVTGSLARWAVQRSAENAFLQVEATNEAALALYATLGFRTHHVYKRYVAPYT